MTAFDPDTLNRGISAAPAPDRGLENAFLILAREMANLADSINHLAVASQGARTPPGYAKPPAGAGPPASASQGPPGDDVTVKMAKKVFAICASNGWDIDDIGTRVFGSSIGGDSRKWSREELSAVLDQLKEWGQG